MDELKKIVAKNITELRLACNMTQLELGREISYSDKAVSKWERGEAIPDAYVLLQLSRLFGVTVDYLLTGHGEEDSPKVTVLKSAPANHLVVALISITGVWTLAALIYVILLLSGINHPMIFQYAVTVCTIVLTVMNTLWGKRIYNLFIISALVWSILLTIYLIFFALSYNWWQLLILGIPAEVIICLCFIVKKPRMIFLRKRKNKNSE